MPDNAFTFEVWAVPDASDDSVKRLIRELARNKRVVELDGTRWGVRYSDWEDRDAAQEELRTVLDEIEKDWRFLVMIA